MRDGGMGDRGGTLISGSFLWKRSAGGGVNVAKVDFSISCSN